MLRLLLSFSLELSLLFEGVSDFRNMYGNATEGLLQSLVRRDTPFVYKCFHNSNNAAAAAPAGAATTRTK